MTLTFESCLRPTKKRRHTGRPLGPLSAAVLATADECGTAVRISLNGRSLARAQNTLRMTAKRHGLRLHYQGEDEQTIIAWCERVA